MTVIIFHWLYSVCYSQSNILWQVHSVYAKFHVNTVENYIYSKLLLLLLSFVFSSHLSVHIWLHIVLDWFWALHLVYLLVLSLLVCVGSCMCLCVFIHAGAHRPSVWARYATFYRSCVWTTHSWIQPQLSADWCGRLGLSYQTKT